MRLSFTARTPGVTSMQGNNNIEPGQHPSVDDGARLHLRVSKVSVLRPAPKTPAQPSKLSLRVSALGASYKSISDENTGCECDWAQADSDRLVLHTV